MMDPERILFAPTEEKVEALREIEEECEWRGEYEAMYVSLLEDADPEVRRLTVAAFWDFPDPVYADVLLRVAGQDDSAQVRTEAYCVLGRYMYESVVTRELDSDSFVRIRSFLYRTVCSTKEDLDVRCRALEALSFDASEDVAALINWAYGHPGPEVNRTAVFCMGRSCSDRWIDLLLRELGSSDRSRQLEAIGAAFEGGFRAATPSLRNLALSKDLDIRLEAIWALSRTRGPGALETLEMCAMDLRPDVRETAEEAIDEYYTCETCTEEDCPYLEFSDSYDELTDESWFDDGEQEPCGF